MSPTGPQLPELVLHTSTSLECWEACGCRMALLVANETALKKIVEKTHVISMVQMVGAQELPYLAQVFLWTRKKYGETMPVDYITIPPEPKLLTQEESDAVRGFMAKLLSNPQELAKEAMCEYNEIRQSATFYRKHPTDEWHYILERVIADGLATYSSVVREAQELRQEQKEQEENELQAAMQLILDPLQYEDKISKEWASDKQGNDTTLETYVALYKCTKNGDRFLAFSKPSMARLCHEKANLPHRNFPLLLARLKSENYVTGESESIKLPQAKGASKINMRLIKIYLEPDDGYKVTHAPLKEKNEMEW